MASFKPAQLPGERKQTIVAGLVTMLKATNQVVFQLSILYQIRRF